MTTEGLPLSGAAGSQQSSWVGHVSCGSRLHPARLVKNRSVVDDFIGWLRSKFPFTHPTVTGSGLTPGDRQDSSSKDRSASITVGSSHSMAAFTPHLMVPFGPMVQEAWDIGGRGIRGQRARMPLIDPRVGARRAILEQGLACRGRRATPPIAPTRLQIPQRGVRAAGGLQPLTAHRVRAGRGPGCPLGSVGTALRSPRIRQRL